MIAITADNNDFETASVDPRFGRCNYIIFYDPENGKYEACQNEAAQAPGGAGIKTAQVVVDRGVNAVITGDIGPNAARVIGSGGIKVYSAKNCKVKEAIRRFEQGELTEVAGNSVQSHYGMKK